MSVITQVVKLDAFNVIPGCVLEMRVGSPVVVTSATHTEHETVKITGWISDGHVQLPATVTSPDGVTRDITLPGMISMELDFCAKVLLAGISIDPNNFDDDNFGIEDSVHKA